MINEREQQFLDSMFGNGKTYVEHPGVFYLEAGDKYYPDFYCKEDDEFIEVAGTRQAYHGNKEKYERFQKEYPNLKFKIVHLWKAAGMKARKTRENTYAKIAAAHGMTPMGVWKIEHGENKTINVPLAIALAEKNGCKPADFINLKVLDYILAEHPELNTVHGVSRTES